MPARAPVLTIDGPSGAGKGTVANRVALRLGWHLLESGALYRLVALQAGREHVAGDDEARLVAITRGLRARFVAAAGGARVELEGRRVDAELGSETVGNRASRIAAIPAVREALLARQRVFRQPPGLVADGRDMGTVVFADAEVKVFLVASAGERARRRYNQLIEKGEAVTLSGLLRDIEERDRRDTMRPVAPLRPAEDAVTIDSTDLAVDQVVDRVLELAANLPGVVGDPPNPVR